MKTESSLFCFGWLCVTGLEVHSHRSHRTPVGGPNCLPEPLGSISSTPLCTVVVWFSIGLLFWCFTGFTFRELSSWSSVPGLWSLAFWCSLATFPACWDLVFCLWSLLFWDVRLLHSGEKYATMSKGKKRYSLTAFSREIY